MLHLEVWHGNSFQGVKVQLSAETCFHDIFNNQMQCLLTCRSWECASPWHSTATSVEQDWATSYRCSIPPYTFVYALCTTVFVLDLLLQDSSSKFQMALCFHILFSHHKYQVKMLHEKIRSDFAYSDFFLRTFVNLD